jgi:hypothetical protein
MHQDNEKKKWPREMAMPVAEEIAELRHYHPTEPNQEP